MSAPNNPTTATVEVNEALRSEIQRVFQAQQKNKLAIGATTAKERIARLDRLHDALLRYREDFHQAVYADFRKPSIEFDSSELFAVTSEIKHVRGELRRWMRDQPVATPMLVFGSKSWVRYESKGVCLIIAPWNYPMQLLIAPLVSAIAAGNTAILKPSEMTPHTSAVLARLVKEVFPENEVALFKGDKETAQHLLDLPFDHIFFTGAPAIGKIIMRAAAKHLTSVTLELGGKSPTIVDETADLDAAARRITWAKFLNKGQTCIAPDYVYVHQKVRDRFLEKVRDYLHTFYGADAAQSESYARMVNHRHFERVAGYIEDSVQAGAKVFAGGSTDGQDNFIAPTVVTDVPTDSALMQDEIFGPVLPVNSFGDIQEVIDVINARPKPLSMYIYSKNQQNIDRLIGMTRAGATAINHSVVYYMNHNLPFGGSNNSGMGNAHGWWGFDAFSEKRAVYKQLLPSATKLVMPPYNDAKRALVEKLMKWF